MSESNGNQSERRGEENVDSEQQNSILPPSNHPLKFITVEEFALLQNKVDVLERQLEGNSVKQQYQSDQDSNNQNSLSPHSKMEKYGNPLLRKMKLEGMRNCSNEYPFQREGYFPCFSNHYISHAHQYTDWFYMRKGACKPCM